MEAGSDAAQAPGKPIHEIFGPVVVTRGQFGDDLLSFLVSQFIEMHQRRILM